MVLEREYPSAWSGSRRSQGGKDRATRVEKEVETAWNFIEWDIETRLPGFASFPSFNRETERERGDSKSGRRGGERLFAYPGDPPLLGNERGDTVTTSYPVTLHYPRQRDGTLVLEKLCRTANTRIHRSCAHTIRCTGYKWSTERKDLGKIVDRR